MAPIAIADDHAVVRNGLRQIIVEAGVHAGRRSVLRRRIDDNLCSRPVDVVVPDLALGDRDGLALIKQFKGREGSGRKRR